MLLLSIPVSKGWIGLKRWVPKDKSIPGALEIELIGSLYAQILCAIDCA